MLKYHNVTYEVKTKKIIDEITFELNPAKITVILGQNGSGKSTILKMLNKKSSDYSGEITYDGQQFVRTSDISILMQATTIPNHFTVQDLLRYSLVAERSIFAKASQRDQVQIEKCLEQCSALNLINQKVGNLSGGERQRVLIAAALVRQPKILILDEPTTYLDVKYQTYILKLIKQLNTELGMTVLMVIHDINHALRIADELILVKEGRIVGQLNATEIDAELLSQVFDVKFKEHGKNSYLSSF